jgi:hypothetical protein
LQSALKAFARHAKKRFLPRKTIKMKLVVIETLDLEVVNYHFLWYFFSKRG